MPAGYIAQKYGVQILHIVMTSMNLPYNPFLVQTYITIRDKNLTNNETALYVVVQSVQEYVAHKQLPPPLRPTVGP